MRAKSIDLQILVWAVIVVLAGELIALTMVACTRTPPLAAQGMVRLAQTSLLVLLVAIRGRGLAAIGLGRATLGRGLKRGLLWSTLFGLAALLFFAVLHAAGISGLALIRARLPASSRDVALFFLVGALIGPMAEEVFFRGIVYGYLRGWGVTVAVAGTTAIFVAAHSLGAGVPLPQIVGGIIFSVAYELEGSLLVPVTIHVLGNTAIFGLSLAARVM